MSDEQLEKIERAEMKKAAGEAAKNIPVLALEKIQKLCAGNGAKADEVTITSMEGEIVEMQGLTHIEVTHDTQMEEKAGKLEVGTLLPSPEAFEPALTEVLAGLTKNGESRKFISGKLLNRPDKGFGSHGEEIALEEMTQEFSAHAPCRTCGGEGKSVCKTCGGRRQQVCTQCHGKTAIPCRNCAGAGQIAGPDGAQKQCTYCFGKRHVGCPLCQERGKMACRQCRGAGAMKCNPCKGLGSFTQIARSIPVAQTLFEMDRAAIPHAAVYAIENSSKQVAAGGHIDFTAKSVLRKDGGMAIQYDALFPYGDVEFDIKGAKYKAHLFGKKPKIMKLKPFLEELIAPGMAALKRAASGQGDAAGLIKKAVRYRLLSRGVILAATQPKKKAALELKKRYPLGIENQSIMKIIGTADKAISHITRIPRYIGLGIGLSVTGVFMAGIYLTDVYKGIVNVLGGGITEVLFAIALIGAFGFMTQYIIKIAGQMAMKKALGDLIAQINQSGGKIKPQVRTRTSGFYGYIGAAVILLIVLFITPLTGHITPSWYPF